MSLEPAAIMQVVVTANTAAANAGLAKLQGQMKATQATGATLGGRLASSAKAGVLGIAGLGAASVAMSTQFEKSMTMVETQAGAPAGEIDKLKDKVLDLARASEFGPNELAEGLYRVESAGFRGAKAMRALNKAQQLADVGQSDLESTTAAYTAALNSGIRGTEKMGKTAGVLSAAVGQGSMKMQDLVGALSTGILPAARSAGLELKDVTSAIDVMTRAGTPANSAATRLRMTFSLMAAPTDAAQKALQSIGLSSTDMAKEMRGPEGLIGAVGLLKEHLSELPKVQQTQVISQVFGGGRTSSGIQTLLNDFGTLRKVFEATGEQASDFRENVEKTEATAAHRFENAVSIMQAGLVELGYNIMPAVSDQVAEFSEIISNPHLTSDQKWQEVGQEISDMVADWVPKIAEAGAKAGLALIKGIGSAFLHADVLGKGIIAAAMIRIIGGAGALRAVGLAMAKMIWEPFMATTAGTYMAQAGATASAAFAKSLRTAIPLAFAAYGVYDIVAGAVGGDTSQQTLYKAGGMAGGAIIGGIAGSFVGMPLLGAAIGGGIGEMIGSSVAPATEEAVKHLSKYQRALKGTWRLMDDYGGYSKEVDKARKDEKESARNLSKAEAHLKEVRAEYPAHSVPVIKAEERVTEARRRSLRASRRLKQAERLEGIERKTSKRIIGSNVKEIQRGISAKEREIRLTRQRLRQDHQDHMGKETIKMDLHRLSVLTKERDKRQNELDKTIRRSAQTIGPKFARTLEDMVDQQRKATRAIDQFSNPLYEADKTMGKATKSANTFRDRLTRAGRDGKVTLSDLERAFAGTGKIGERSMDRLQDSIKNMNEKGSRSLGSFRGAARDAITGVEADTNSALKGLGLKPVSFGVSSGDSGSSKPGKSARGSTIVPGIQGGDRHLLSLNGQPISWVESGEKIAVVNREAAKAEMALNSSIPRYASGGVIQQAGGPYAIPPIQYWPDHAGSNSHLHLDFFTVAQALAYGHRMQGMGWNISEYTPKGGNPWGFGGVTTQHQSPGHYDGTAFDANTAADETRAEVEAVVRLLTGGKVQGAVADKIKKRLIDGPDGALKSIDQAVADKVVKGANAYIAKHAPAEGVNASYVDGGDGAVAAQMGRILLKTGWNRSGAAGVIGNAYRESLWNPASVGTGGGGLFGFTTSPISLADLQNYARGHGKPWTDVGIQMQFMQEHLTSDVKQAVMAAGSPAAAAERFMTLWERPGIPALEERQAAAVRAYNMKSWRKGGLINLARGGALDLNGAIDKTFKAKDPDKDAKGDPPTAAEIRKKVADRLRKKIAALSEVGKKEHLLLSGDGSAIAGALQEARDQVDKYGEFSGYAASLGDGGGVFLPGGKDKVKPIDGLTTGSEAFWTTLQLGALQKLRALLIHTDLMLEARQKEVNSYVKKAARRLKHWERSLSKIQKAIGKDGELPEDWGKEDPDPVSDSIESWNKLDKDKRLKFFHKFVKAGGTLPGDRAFSDSGKLVEVSASPYQAVVNLIKGTMVSGFQTESRQIKDSLGAIGDELKTVQGPVDNMRRYKKLPPLGTLGGEIFEAQNSLAGIGGGSGLGSGPDNDLELALLRELLREANLRTAVSQAQYGVLEGTPVLGAFASGGQVGRSGLYLTGEQGPEVVSLPAGAQVTPNSSLGEIGAGSVTIYVNGDVISDAPDPFEVVIGDKRFPAAVKRVTRSQAKAGGRVLPGRGGK